MTEERRLFKDEIDRAVVAAIAEAVVAVDPSVDADRFRRRAVRGLAPLELKARVAHVAAALGQALAHHPFPAAAEVVCDAADGGPVDGWAAWPLVTWVEQSGLDHPDAALAALRRLTGHASAEFAVRPFLERHPERTLGMMRGWTSDPDVHVRRLVSEGTRPRLPWGRRLPAFVADPSPVLELLDRLVLDEEEYVRRSVANNLNDIAKDHPALAVATAARWVAEAPEARTADISWVASRALRTLVKDGDPAALAVLGFDHGADVEVRSFSLSPDEVDMGDDVVLEVELAKPTDADVRLVVDYRLHRVVADGSHSAKVFKWRTLTVPAGTSVALQKRHRLRPVTVRTMHPGVHVVELQVNGSPRGGERFLLRRGG